MKMKIEFWVLRVLCRVLRLWVTGKIWEILRVGLDFARVLGIFKEV